MCVFYKSWESWDIFRFNYQQAQKSRELARLGYQLVTVALPRYLPALVLKGITSPLVSLSSSR